MPDREKVIKGLEVCRDQDNPPGHRFTGCKDDCPYYGNGCAKKLKEDAMDQLKEQPEIVLCKDCKWWDKKKGSPYGYCHACQHGYFSENWDIEIYRTYKGDWFCAEGERRK